MKAKRSDGSSETHPALRLADNARALPSHSGYPC